MGNSAMDKKAKGDDMKTIQTYATRMDAEVAKSVLDAGHIPSIIMSDDAGGMYPFLTTTGFTRVRLCVKTKDVSKACRLLKG